MNSVPKAVSFPDVVVHLDETVKSPERAFPSDIPKNATTSATGSRTAAPTPNAAAHLQTPLRQFGTDLTRVFGNFTPGSAKAKTGKKLRVKSSSSSSAIKPKKRYAQHNVGHNQTMGQHNPSNIDTQQYMGYGDYTITFEPGPIGMQLEPISESQGKEIGCRVLQFINLPSGQRGQAERSGKISPGDVLIQVNHTNVISWTYPDVIRYLKMLPPTQSKHLMFKSVQSIAEDFWQQQPSSTDQRTVGNVRRMEHDGNWGPVHTEKVLTNHILKTLPASEPCRQKPMVFSPSKVKALSQQRRSVVHNTVHDTSRESDDTSTTTTTTTALALQRKPTAFASKLASQMTNKLAQVLMVENQPTSAKELNQAVQLKMQLLTELSHAKITIDAKVQEKGRLENIIRNLSSELDLTRSENTNLLCQITSWKDAKTSLEKLFEDALTKQDCVMEEQKRAFQMEKDVLANQIDTLAGQVATLQQGQVHADKDLKNIQTEFQKKVDYALEMETKVKKLEQVVAHQQATIEVAQSELETSRCAHQEDNRLKDELVKFATVHAAQLENVISKHDATAKLTDSTMKEASRAPLDKVNISFQHDVISSIKCHAARLEGILGHQRATIDKKDTELVKMRGQFDAEMRMKDALVLNTQARARQLEGAVTELQTSLDEARQKLTDARSKFAEDVASMEILKSSLQDQTDELESELQRVKSANTVLAGSKDDLKTALEQTVCQFESTSNDLRLLKTKANAETLKRSQLEDQLRIVKELCEGKEFAISQLQSDKDIAKSRLEQEINKRSHAEDQLQVVQRTCETHESTISQLTSEKRNVEDRLHEATVKLSHAEDRLKTVQQLCASHEAAISQLQSAKDTAESRLEEETSKRSQFEVQLGVIKGICETHESTISQLQSEKDDVQSRLEVETVKRSHAEDQLRFVKEACGRHESKVSQLQSEKDIADSRLEQETIQRSHAQDQLQFLRELCERHESSISQLQSDNVIADKHLDEATVKLSHAENQLNIVQGLCEARALSISQLQSDKDTAEGRLEEATIKLVQAENQLKIVQELCEAHASSISQLLSEKKTAESRLDEETIKLSHAEKRLIIVQELCEAHASSISQLQTEKETAESRLEEEAIKRLHAEGQLRLVQGVCERHELSITHIQTEKDTAESRLQQEMIKRSHAEDQLRRVQGVCERHESTISQLQSEKDIAENRLEDVRAELSKHYDEAVKQTFNRRKVLDDFKVLVEEQERAVSASAEISTALKQNHAELLTDLATFQIILDASCDNYIVDDSATTCLRALQSHQYTPRLSSSISSFPSSAPNELVASENDAETNKITSAAATLGIMKHDVRLSALKGDILDSDAMVHYSLQQHSIQPMSTRVEQLERFLHDVLLENEVLGSEARGLRSQLDETKSCYDNELKELRTEIAILQKGEQRHMEELDDIRQKQQESDAKANIRAKVIATLQSQLDNEVGNYKAKQSEFVDDVERHVHCLEEEVRKALEANIRLHSSLSDTNSKLASADRLVDCLRANALACAKQLQAMFSSIREGILATTDADTNQSPMAFDEEHSTEDLQRCIENLQEQLAQLLFHREKAISDLQSCKAKLEEQSKRTENLDVEFQAMLKDRTESERLYQEQTCRISSLEQSKKSLRDQLQKQAEEVQCLNDILSATQQEVSELQTCLDLVRREKVEIADSLQSQISEVQRLNTTVTSNENLTNQLKETLSLMKNKEIENDERLQEKDKEIERLKAIHENAKETIAALETELCSRTSEFHSNHSRLEAENTDLKESLHDLENEHRTRLATIENQKKEIARLRETLRSSEEEANHLADEIIRHRQSREQLENDRTVLQSEVDWLHREVQSQDEAAKFLQKRVVELQGDAYPPYLNDGYGEYPKQLMSDASGLPSSTEVTCGITSPGTVASISDESLRKSAAALLIDNVLLNRERSELGRGFRQWSANAKAMGAVSHHLQVAEVMNRQLQTTWSKVSALKSHLKAQQGGGR